MLINPNLAARTNPQNLISQVTPEQAAHPKGRYAGIVLDVISVAAAAFLGWAYHAYLTAGESVILPLLALVCFTVPTLLSVLLVRRRIRRLAVVLLQVIAVAGWFFAPDRASDPFFLGAAAAGFALLATGDERGKREYDNSLKLKFSQIMRPTLRLLLTALVLLGVLLYIPKENGPETLVPRSAFDRIFAQGASFAKRWYPTLDIDGTVKNFAQAAAEREADADPRVGALPAAVRAQVISQAVDQFLVSMKQYLGVDVRPEEKLGTAFYRAVTTKIGEWYEASREAFLVGWAAFLFFLFRGVAFLLYYPLLGITRFVFEILIAGNVIHVGGETRLHEVVEYS